MSSGHRAFTPGGLTPACAPGSHPASTPQGRRRVYARRSCTSFISMLPLCSTTPNKQKFPKKPTNTPRLASRTSSFYPRFLNITINHNVASHRACRFHLHLMGDLRCLSGKFPDGRTDERKYRLDRRRHVPHPLLQKGI